VVFFCGICPHKAPTLDQGRPVNTNRDVHAGDWLLKLILISIIIGLWL
jgi:hypothetical protein